VKVFRIAERRLIMSDAHINPADYINYYATTKGISIDDIGVAPLVVVSWSSQVIKSLAKKCGATPQEHWVKGADNLFTGEVNGKRVSFSNLPVGASATVMMMEELIACGASSFIGLGWAGSLQTSLPIGSMIIPDECICEEGTSIHYKKKGASISANDYLKSQLQFAANSLRMKTTVGTQWTIDAPYRELKSKAVKYRDLGVLGVEMETSAMYALGGFRDVKVCNLLVISDELWDVWKPAFHSPELSKANERAEDVIIECIKNLKI
jgi:uridine phosphorylase